MPFPVITLPLISLLPGGVLVPLRCNSQRYTSGKRSRHPRADPSKAQRISQGAAELDASVETSAGYGGQKVQIRKRNVGRGIYEGTVLYSTLPRTHVSASCSACMRDGAFPNNTSSITVSACAQKPVTHSQADAGGWRGMESPCKLVGCCLSSLLSCFLSPVFSLLSCLIFSSLLSLLSHYGSSSIQEKAQ